MKVAIATCVCNSATAVLCFVGDGERLVADRRGEQTDQTLVRDSTQERRPDRRVERFGGQGPSTSGEAVARDRVEDPLDAGSFAAAL